MNVRNSYLITHAIRNYLWASLMSSAIMQLTVTVDAIILGHYVGSDALSAVSLVMPLTMLVSALSTLIGVGPAIMASKAIGNRQIGKVNMVFTSAVFQAVIIGGCIGIACWGFSDQIASLLCGNGHLLPYLVDYLQVLPWCFGLTILVSSLVCLIEADGHPQLAAKALLVGCLWHVCFDVLCVGYLDMGIKGAAYAMLVNNVLVIVVFALRMRRQDVSYRWQWPKKNIMNVTLAGLKEGMPMLVNELMYSLMLFLLNRLVGVSLGEQGLFYWAICIQLLMLVLVVVDGAEGAVLSIGGMLIGEKDGRGFYMLVCRLVILITGVVAGIMLVVCCFPDGVAGIFSYGVEMPAEWSTVVRIFSLMLVPYALSLFMRSCFQVMARRWLAMLFSTLQALCMVAGLWAVSHWAPSWVWWSLPLSAFLSLLVQAGIIVCLRMKHNGCGLLSVDNDEGCEVMELSVGYDTEPVVDAISQVCGFLERRTVDRVSVMAVNICCEELMLNIVRHQSHKHRPYMDLRVAVGGGKVCLALKDAGRPFNPILPSHDINLEDSDVSLGLALVNSVCTTLSHKYMYGQNVVFAEFQSERTL